MEDLRNNPFSSLFLTLQQAEEFSADKRNGNSGLHLNRQLSENSKDVLLHQIHEHSEDSVTRTVNLSASILQETSNAIVETVVVDNVQTNRIIEEIFLITLESDLSDKAMQCVYLEDFYATINTQNWLDLKYLEQAVFERIMMPDPGKYLVHTRNKSDVDGSAAETRIMYYLFNCYTRWKTAKEKYKGHEAKALAACHLAIAGSSQTALAHPDILPNSETHKQMKELMVEYKKDEKIMGFLNTVVESVQLAFEKDGEPSVLEIFAPILDDISKMLGSPSIAEISTLNYIDILHAFSSHTSLALAFMEYNTPKKVNNGKAYEVTLLGKIFSISSIPKVERGPFEFFENPGSSTQLEQERIEQIIWTNLKKISSEIYHLLNSMVRLSSDVRHAILTWLGNCLHENSGKAKLWNNHMNMFANLSHVSDGFLLNLGCVLLHFCQPFCAPKSPKLLLIDSLYCAGRLQENEQAKTRGLHMKNMTEETCLIPAEATEEIPQSPTYNFTTECFFMTHRTLQLGFHAVHERVAKVINDLRRLQRLYMETSQGGASSEAIQDMKNEIERLTSVYLCTKAHMMFPDMLEMMMKFYAATSVWLVNISISNDCTQFHSVRFPLPDDVPICLSCIPEFILDNVADFSSVLRRFNPLIFETAGDLLEYFMTFILVFMGSAERVRNPHLRAKLAEALDGLMPHRNEINPKMAIISTFYREQLFNSHPHMKELVTMLLQVFVGIEMTGQSVAFEQKFNYRRPMYEVMAYILELPVHQKSVKHLAKEAEDNITSTQPPLFLRFINLLVNDAIYLLDEGLLHMSSLREHQRKRETEEYRQLSRESQQESEMTFRHTGMLAQFHNVMGRQTINTLRLLTREVVSIFVHPTMVDRVAAMLNYFLLHLVGPKSRDLKVQDMGEYEFKPQELVAGICGIYINLGKRKAFWRAVATDGRSYSPNLFSKAEDVLCRIGHANLVPDFLQVAKDVKECADQLKIQEESLFDAPEEFLDPIMGTFMYNPVILPSSHVIVDHSTIARHLLSDQSDPFNRSPLSMDMIQPAVELKGRIDEWLKVNQASASSSTTS